MGQAMGWILIGARKTTAPMVKVVGGAADISWSTGESPSGSDPSADQSDRFTMADALDLLRVVTPAQREHVDGATYFDTLFLKRGRACYSLGCQAS